MMRTCKQWAVALYTAAIVAALGIGAMEAFGGSAAHHCEMEPWVGTCISLDDCQDLCDAIHGPGNSTASCELTSGHLCCTCWQ